MRRETRTKGSVFSLAVAIAILVFLKMVIFTEDRPPEDAPGFPVTIARHETPFMPEGIEKFGPPEKPDFAPAMELGKTEPLVPLADYERDAMAQKPQWIANAVATDVPKGKPRVVIIIDDMGLDRKHTQEIMDLPGPLTLAFLPYAGDLKGQTGYGRERGHELMVHVPMEPMRPSADAGPSPLLSALPIERFNRILQEDLDAFDGYVGINNHMGSKLTQVRPAMALVMGALKERGLLFVDSRTINTSVAADEAQKAGIPFATRDVFIDHEETYEAASDALAQVEKKALKDGLAIAIGHPKAKTIQALREWLPTLEAKGIYVVPVSAAVREPAQESGIK